MARPKAVKDGVFQLLQGMSFGLDRRRLCKEPLLLAGERILAEALGSGWNLLDDGSE